MILWSQNYYLILWQHVATVSLQSLLLSFYDLRIIMLNTLTNQLLPDISYYRIHSMMLLSFYDLGIIIVFSDNTSQLFHYDHYYQTFTLLISDISYYDHELISEINPPIIYRVSFVFTLTIILWYHYHSMISELLSYSFYDLIIILWSRNYHVVTASTIPIDESLLDAQQVGK